MKLIPYTRYMYNLINNRTEIIKDIKSRTRYKNKNYLSNKKDIDYFINEMNKIKEYNTLIYTELLTHYNNKISHMYFYNDSKRVEVFL